MRCGLARRIWLRRVRGRAPAVRAGLDGGDARRPAPVTLTCIFNLADAHAMGNPQLALPLAEGACAGTSRRWARSTRRNSGHEHISDVHYEMSGDRLCPWRGDCWAQRRAEQRARETQISINRVANILGEWATGARRCTRRTAALAAR